MVKLLEDIKATTETQTLTLLLTETTQPKTSHFTQSELCDANNQVRTEVCVAFAVHMKYNPVGFMNKSQRHHQVKGLNLYLL